MEPPAKLVVFVIKQKPCLILNQARFLLMLFTFYPNMIGELFAPKEHQ